MWRFLDSGFQSGSVNMQTDQALASALVRGEGGEVLRVYGWRPWTLSLGWNQSGDDLERGRLAADGIDVVRRPTGGRAVLHANELTYSVVINADGRTNAGIYERVSRGLVAAVRRLGVPASIEAGSLPAGHARTMACFVSTSRFEVKANGRKLVGSAQRRFAAEDGREVVLQHGSLLLGDEHTRIVDYLCLRPEERESLRSELRERSADLRGILGRVVEFEEAAAAMRAGFEEAWEIAMTPFVSHSGVPLS